MSNIHLWKGTPLTDLSKEELIEALIEMNNLYDETYKDLRKANRKALERCQQ